MSKNSRLCLTLSTLALACTEVGGPSGTDAGTNNTCALTLPDVTCTEAACSATTGTKAFGYADVPTGKNQLAVAWASSEVYAAADTRTLYYGLQTQGGLTPRGERRAKPPMDPALAAALEHPAVLAKLAWERELRAMTKKGPIQGRPFGTAMRAVDLLPPGVRKQNQACTAGPHTCGDAAICVIPEGTQAGTCAGMVNLKFYGRGPTAADVTAQVVKVGAKAAILVEASEAASVSATDAAELIRRFETHIAPRVHQLFGEPLVEGKDRDGNGVVSFLFTSRVAAIDANLAGFFLADDMRPTADVSHSNASDILYLQAPGANVSMDGLSGTIAHEYQHLINFSSKVLRGQSDQEEVWLDEGLSGFAEDITGYGVDAFANVGAFLTDAATTPLTGNDTLAVRGFGLLMVRYLYEQAGGATFAGAGEGTDKGGIAKIKAIVSGAETGLDALMKGAPAGSDFHRLLGDLATTIALDGASDSSLTCNAKYAFAGPETDAFTNAQRGLHVRGMVPGRSGPITLRGPSTSELVTDGSLVPLNGVEFVDVPSASTQRRFSVGGASDDTIGLRIVPKP